LRVQALVLQIHDCISHIQIPHTLRIILDKLAPRLDFVAHTSRKPNRQSSLAASCAVRVLHRAPKLLGIHFAATFSQYQAATAFVTSRPAAFFCGRRRRNSSMASIAYASKKLALQD
jgi:hypothetical protein